jgi:hypothetical protein
MPVFFDEVVLVDAARLLEEALRAEPADARRFVGALLAVLLVVRAAVRFAFFAFAICGRPLLLGVKVSHDNNRTGNEFHAAQAGPKTYPP